MSTFYWGGLILLVAAYYIFRRQVLGDYRKYGHLTLATAVLQLAVFLGLLALPYTFNPPAWPFFWLLSGPTSLTQQVYGLVVIVAGGLLAFGVMFWFGWRRALGLQADRLVCSGLYRLTRNPQVLGGYLMAIGMAIQWPSWDALTFIGIYGVIVHWMILSEEEHLLLRFGKEYTEYCNRIPRYLWRGFGKGRV